MQNEADDSIDESAPVLAIKDIEDPGDRIPAHHVAPPQPASKPWYKRAATKARTFVNEKILRRKQVK